MTKSFRISLTALSGLVVILLIIGLSQVQWPVKKSTTTGTIHTSTTCQVQGNLPDPSCTPGAVDPAVTQENIQTTICVAGYTKTVRPPTSVTNPIKEERMAAYGLLGSRSDYQLDHLIPLTIGGAPARIENLWPEAYLGLDGARKKDTLEKKLNNLVCAGDVPLGLAQQAMATNWWQAYQLYVR